MDGEASSQAEGSDGGGIFEEEAPYEARHPYYFKGHEDLDFVVKDDG
jgi:hypothetical protein